jgi:protein-S-isoprenylcysteine O-methyltransferase Ste14
MADHEEPAGTDSDQSDEHAGVRFPPPFIYISCLAAGILSDSPWINGDLATVPVMVAGIVIFLVGGLLARKSVPRHKKEGTNVEPWKPTVKIISDGVYGWTRNPIYVSMTLGYFGIAIAADSTAALVYLIPCLLVVRYYVIGREERYLEARFGEEYLAYKAKVRRWF